MKGIILAGGTGKRLFPATLGISKQLIPIYDKPMIYYPLSTLMLAGIRESGHYHSDRRGRVSTLLGGGCAIRHQSRLRLTGNPRGLADAFVIGRKFVGGDSVAVDIRG